MKTKFLIPLIAGLAMLYACKGKTGYEVVNTGNNAANAVESDADSVSNPKLIKTAALNFKVKNVQQTATRVTALTESFGGMVMQQQSGSVPENSEDVRVSTDSVLRVTAFRTTADIMVKIPSARLEKFMDSVQTMGIYVTNRNLDITDKSLDYLSARLKLKSRTDLVSRQKAGTVIIKDPARVLDLKDDMIDQQIGNRQIDDAVKNSTVSLSFYQSNTINKEMIANDDPSAYGLPFFKRIGVALENGVQLFGDVLVAIADIWLFILAGIGVLVMIRVYKRRKGVAMVKVG